MTSFVFVIIYIHYIVRFYHNCRICVINGILASGRQRRGLGLGFCGSAVAVAELGRRAAGDEGQAVVSRNWGPILGVPGKAIEYGS